MVWVRLLPLLALFATVAFAATASVAAEDTDAAVAVARSASPAPPAAEHDWPSRRVPAPAPEPRATAVMAPPPVAGPSPTVVPGRTDVPARPVVPESARAHVVDPGSRLAVGALFSGDGHYCSASVVDSPKGNLVLTAAHCVHDGAGGGAFTNVTFEPGYHDGTAPFGVWAVSQIFVAPGWEATSDPDLDFAFLTVHQDGNPASLESLTGANRLGSDRGYTNTVAVTGYPDSADAPVTCLNTTTQQGVNQMQISCPGLSEGTSGSPWVLDVDPATNLGTVIGVVGGFEAGGDDDVSYSSYFDADIEALYRASVTG